MIKFQGVSFNYDQFSVLRDLSFHIKPGEFIAILGKNGSGKSTLAKMINALLIPTKGEVWIDGLLTKEEKNTIAIREKAGMVFQNPDNQIVATLVEEDVAFGPENLGIEPSEIRRRVDLALQILKLDRYKKTSPSMLSGGQKQRLALAGILAMNPSIIVLDESTSMLDPMGRKEVLNYIKKINQEEKITIVFITHYMEEAMLADRIFLMDEGQIIHQGDPDYFFSNPVTIQDAGLLLPQITELSYLLIEKKLPIEKTYTDYKELAGALCRLI